MMKRRSLLQDSRGMTLVEIIAVVVLIALVMGVVAKGVFGKSDQAKGALNKTKMEKLQNIVETYRLQYNRYPTKLDDLITKSGDIGSSYFTAMAEKDDFGDLWGGDYVYKTENNNRSYTITSLGKDGVPGGQGPDQDLVIGPGAK